MLKDQIPIDWNLPLTTFRGFFAGGTNHSAHLQVGLFPKVWFRCCTFGGEVPKYDKVHARCTLFDGTLHTLRCLHCPSKFVQLQTFVDDSVGYHLPTGDSASNPC